MGLSAPSSGKATGASPLRASLHSVLPSVHNRNYCGFRTISIGISHWSLPAQSLASLGTTPSVQQRN